MLSEPNGAPAPVARPKRPAPRLTRSRLARPLLTSLGTASMLAASTFVILAVSSTGSFAPWNWSRMDPSLAASRYEYCGQQGLGAIGCMLSLGFRPASAAGAPASSNRSAQPLLSVATVADQAPAGSSSTAAGQGARSSAGQRSTSGAHVGMPASRHLVNVPANASMNDVLAACQAAMKTAQTQGTTAMTEVESECEKDFESRCPTTTVKTPQANGPAAIQELEDECMGRPQSSPSPGHDD